MSNSGWNRPSSTRPPVPKKPSAVRGIVAGIVVVILAIAGAWYFLVRDSSVAERQGKDQGLIKETTPAKARKQMEKPKRRTVVKTGDRLKDALAEVEASDELVKIDASNRKLPAKIPPLPFNSGVEQVMCWVFSRRLGDVPMVVPSISDEERAKMADILISKMKIEEGDSEDVIAVKETVDYAKKEMAKYIGDGGDPQDFLNYYVEQQCLAYDTFMDAQQQYNQIYEEDKAMAKEFAKQANELLAQKGIKPIEEEQEEDAESLVEQESQTQTGETL